MFEWKVLKMSCWQYFFFVLQLPMRVNQTFLKLWAATMKIRMVFKQWHGIVLKKHKTYYNFRRFWKIPQLTFQISESYFENNALLSETRDGYVKKNGFYQKSVDNKDLNIQFADKDCKYWNSWIDLPYCKRTELGARGRTPCHTSWTGV